MGESGGIQLKLYVTICKDVNKMYKIQDKLKYRSKYNYPLKLVLVYFVT